MVRQFDTDEIEWYNDTTTVAMDHIGKYFSTNGNMNYFLEICHNLYWYISVYGYRPVNFVEDRFLEKMGVEPRCAEN